MATKSVIEIPVETAQFERFIALFENYEAQLTAQPAIWDRINAAMGGALGGASAEAATAKMELAAAAAQAALIAEALAGAHKATRTVANDAETADKGLGKVAKTAQGLGKSILAAGKNLVAGFGPAALAALGIGAIGSGFGIVELADSALARWKAAAGLGLTPGQAASYQVYGQQFLGPGALQGAANAQIDLSKAGWLSVLGISQNQATAEPASTLAFQELLSARRAWQQAAPGTQLQQPGVQAALALGLSVEEIRRAASVTQAQLQQTADDVKKNAAAFDLLTAAWMPLKIQLDAAGRSIETNLSNALARANLPQALTGLSVDFTALINSLINSGGVAWALRELAAGARWLQQELTPENVKTELAKLSDGFQAVTAFLGSVSWKDVGADVKLMGSEINVVAQKLKWLVPNASNTSEADFRNQDYPTADTAKPVPPRDLLDNQTKRAIGRDEKAAWKWLITPTGIAADVLKSLTKPIAGQASAATIAGIIQTESGGNPNAVSRTGAQGLMQLEPGTAAMLGVKNPFDPGQNITGGVRYINQLYRQFGQWDKAFAAYNEGPGALEKDISQYRGDWFAHLPKPVQQYVIDVKHNAAAAYANLPAQLYGRITSADRAFAALRSDVHQHGAAYAKFFPKAVEAELHSIFGAHMSDADILKALHIAMPKAAAETKPEPKPNDSAMTKHTDRLVKAIKAKSRPKPAQISVTNSTASRIAVSLQAAAAGAFA